VKWPREVESVGLVHDWNGYCRRTCRYPVSDAAVVVECCQAIWRPWHGEKRHDHCAQCITAAQFLRFRETHEDIRSTDTNAFAHCLLCVIKIA